MIKKIFIIILGITLFFLAVFLAYNRDVELLFLSNNNIKVGILPDAGGRIVIFKSQNGDNILKEQPELWKKRHIPKPALDVRDVRLMGHIVWVSPQVEWWAQQSLNESKKIKKPTWPPDPFTIYARYKILEHTATNLIMVAPASPITGLEMIKSFVISSNCLTLSTTAVNRRESDVSWGLWSNTRLLPKHPVTIPVASTNDIIGFELGYGSKDIYMPYVITNNYFVYDYRFEERDLSELKVATKLYINPLIKEYTTIVGEYIFKKIAVTEIDNVHSNHSSMELYVEFDPIIGDLMEQEFHGNYQNLKPGESTSFVEIWELTKNK